MNLKYNKLCTFSIDLAEKLNAEPNRKTNLVINEAVKAHYDNRIIPKNCKVEKLDVTDWIISEIKKSEQVDELDFSFKTSSFTISKKDGIIDKIVFYLKSKEIEIDIKFNVIVENDIVIQFIRWDHGSIYRLDFDDNRLKEIEESVIFKL